MFIGADRCCGTCVSRCNGHSNGHDNSPDTCEAVPLEGKATVLYSTSKADLKGEDRFDLRPLMTATAKDVSGMRREKLFSYFAVLDGHNGQACVDYAVRDPLCTDISVSYTDAWSCCFLIFLRTG